MSDLERTDFSSMPVILQLSSDTCKALVLPVAIQQSINNTAMVGGLLEDTTSLLPLNRQTNGLLSQLVP